MRQRIPLECFDPVSLWPRRVFNGFTEAAEFGYKRSLIDKVLKGDRKSHRELGWRYADGTSRLGEFIDWNCVLSPDALISLAELVRAFAKAVEGVDAARARSLIRCSFSTFWVPLRLPPPRYLENVEVVRGLQWRDPPPGHLPIASLLSGG